MTARLLAAIAACLLAALPAAAAAVAIDPAASSIGFTLKTYWGRTLMGRFPQYAGDIERLPDGRHRVRLQLSASDVVIVGSDTFTRLTRGDGFFDADRFPWVEFVSDAYPVSLAREGGRLGGLLTIRGVTRRETFTLQPTTCDRPAVDCDVVARGSVDRNDYGVDRWGFAVSSRVVFTLRVRTRDEHADGAPRTETDQ